MSHGMNNNKLTKHFWVWPIACYLFLGGLGGGMLFFAGLFDLIFSPMIGASIGPVFALGVFIAVVALGIGSFLLVFELGQPFVFLRVFLSKTAIIKWGAVLLSVALIFGFVYFLFFLPPEWNLFFYGWTWIRDICCVVMMVTGICVVLYTGVLLSSFKARAFWNTPVLPVLFSVSALSTASALLAVTAGMWPAPELLAVSGFVVPMHDLSEVFVEYMHLIDTVLVAVELIILLVYILMMYGAGNNTARKTALNWLKGSYAPLFWGGLIICGLLLPFLFYLTGGVLAAVIAPILVLSAGLLLRFMIVFSDVRRPIPGEERFYSRLPKGDEKFLTASETKSH